MKSPPRVPGRIQRALSDPSWENRYLALKQLPRLLARLSRDGALDWVRRSSRDSRLAIRCLAATVLGEIARKWPEEAVLDVLVPLTRDDDPWVRLRAVQALACLPAPLAAEPVRQVLIREKDLRVRATTVKTLGSFADPAHLPLLISFLADPDARVRANTVEGLGHFDAAMVAELLLPCLDDPSPRVMVNAARELYRFNRERALRTFQSLAESDRPGARASVAHAVGALQEPALLDLLIKLVTDPVEQVRRNAVGSLARLGSRAEPRALALLSDPRREVRVAACQVLGRVGGPESYTQLLELLSDVDGDVRGACERALSLLELRFAGEEVDE
ncbi:MAG: HEAT repeat domain-containing protein [Candidatus Riflebacteria bacterium]|nr:HEAT repeat domain-containing protein [Candidatus Riflebacteria bacterium]